MIKITLLGGARKAIGAPSLDLDKKQTSIFELLSYLQKISLEPRLLEERNLIIAINGVDSQALSGPNTIVEDGDNVTIVTVVHGGREEFDNIDGVDADDGEGKTKQNAIVVKVKEGEEDREQKNRTDRWQVLVAGIRRVNSIDEKDSGELLRRIRRENPNVTMQIADASAIYDQSHAVGALNIAIEAMAREVMIANKPEIEVLLRIACTDQIAEAMKRARLRNDADGCVVAFSADSEALQKLREQIGHEFSLDESVIAPSAKKKEMLAKLVGIQQVQTNTDKEFVELLLERAAILVKK